MSRSQLEQKQSGESSYKSMPSTMKNNGKKPRPKFTILEDMEQLNEIINGPGAKQENLRAQELIQKTYQCMKGNTMQEENNKESNQDENRGKMNKEQLKGGQEKQNSDMINLSRCERDETFDELLKRISGPRIIVQIKKLNTSSKSPKQMLRINGFENLIAYSNNHTETRAQSNSYQDQGEGMLFSEALQMTERNKMKVSKIINQQIPVKKFN